MLYLATRSKIIDTVFTAIFTHHSPFYKTLKVLKEWIIIIIVIVVYMRKRMFLLM